MRFWVFLLFIPALARANCDPPQMFMQNLEDIQNVVEKIEEAPFQLACKHEGATKDRPKTGLFRRAVPPGSGEKTAGKILGGIVEKIEARIQQNRNMALGLEKCLSAKEETPECAEVNTWATKELPDYVREARYHLALAQSPSELSTWRMKGKTDINASLDGLGSYRANSWKPLTQLETRPVEAAMSGYREDIKHETLGRLFDQKLKPEDRDKFENDAMLLARYKHFKKYHEMASELLFMQHITSDIPIKSEVLEASQKIQKSLNKEQKYINKLKKLVAEGERTGHYDPEVLELMNYETEVEATLIENPELCPLATSMVYTKQNRGIGKALAIGLPVLAASFVVSPWIAIPAGAALGLYGVKESQDDYKRAARLTTSQVYKNELGRDLENAESARKQRNWDMVTLPMGYGLLGMAGKTLKVGGAAASVMEKVAMRVPSSVAGPSVERMRQMMEKLRTKSPSS